jgi:N-sulfoglucosamine sulfohydrolase
MMEIKGLLNNTLIVFIGDHGPDLTRGKFFAYATATHIPVIVKWPCHSEAGLVRDELVSTIDLFPTFLSAAGGKVTDKRQTGLSLQPLLENNKAKWREWPGTEFIAHKPWDYYPRYSVLTDRYQLIVNLEAKQRKNPFTNYGYCPAWWEVQKSSYEETKLREVYDHVVSPPEIELFDLKSDPYLFQNLAGKPEFEQIEKKLIKQIRDWRVQTKDPFLDSKYGKKVINPQKLKEIQAKLEKEVNWENLVN